MKTDREREEEYYQPNPYPASRRMIRMADALLVGLLLALIVMALVRGVEAEADHWLCRVNESWSLGMPVEFDMKAYEFIDFPADAQIVDILYIEEDMNAAYVVYYADGDLIVFPFWSLEARADQQGDHMGNHDFCTPRRYALGED